MKSFWGGLLWGLVCLVFGLLLWLFLIFLFVVRLRIVGTPWEFQHNFAHPFAADFRALHERFCVVPRFCIVQNYFVNEVCDKRDFVCFVLQILFPKVNRSQKIFESVTACTQDMRGLSLLGRRVPGASPARLAARGRRTARPA